MRTGADDRVQRGKRVGGHVDGAMEGNRQGGREFDQGAGARHVDAALFVEQAEDDAVDAERASLGYLFAHNFEFNLGVEKVTAARADHDKNVEANMAAHRGNEPGTGGKTAFEQIRAEFHTTRSAALGGDGRLHRIYTNFKLHLIVSQSRKRFGPPLKN